MSRKHSCVRKRVFTVLLSIVFLFEGIFANKVMALAAEEFPVVTDVVFGSTNEDDFVVTATGAADNGTLYLRSLNTGELVEVAFSGSYWDEGQNSNVAYEDGKMHGKLPKTKIVNAGVFAIDAITIVDKNGVSKKYIGLGNPTYNECEEEIRLEKSIAQKTVEIVDLGEDRQPPELKSISWGKNVFEGRDWTDIEAELVDNAAGVKECKITFVNTEGEEDIKERYGEIKMETSIKCELRPYKPYTLNERYEDGMWRATLCIDEWYASGKYEISELYMKDLAGNSITYTKDDMPEQIRDWTFEIKKGSSKCSIKNITIENPQIAVPSAVTLNVSHMCRERVVLLFRNVKTGVLEEFIIQPSCEPYENNEWDEQLTLKIEKHLEKGEYILDSLTYNYASAKWFYAKANPDYENVSEEFRVPEEFAGLSFRVTQYNDASLELQSVSLDKTIFEGCDYTVINLKAAENVRWANIIFTHTESEEAIKERYGNVEMETQIECSLRQVKNPDTGRVYENGSLQGVLMIHEGCASGKYEVSEIQLQTIDGQNFTYTKYNLTDVMKGLSFEIKKGSSKWPIQTLKFSPYKIRLDEEMKIEYSILRYIDSVCLLPEWSFINTQGSEIITLSVSQNESSRSDGIWNAKASTKIVEHELGKYMLYSVSYMGKEFYTKRNPNYENSSEEFRVPDEMSELSFELIDKEEILVVPTIESIIIEKSVLEGVDSMEVKAKINDNGIEIGKVIVSFINEEDDETIAERYGDIVDMMSSRKGAGLSQYDKSTGKKYKDGFMHGEIRTGGHDASGKYFLNAVTFYGVEDNVLVKYENIELPKNIRDISFEIQRGSSKCPLDMITLEKEKVIAPGIILVQMDLRGTTVNLNFRNTRTNRLYKFYSGGQAYNCIEVSEYFEQGTYVLDSIEFPDDYRTYYAKGNPEYENINPEFRVPSGYTELSFYVDNRPTIKTSIMDDKLIQQIKDMEDNGIIVVDYEGKAIAKSEIFSAIDETSKEVDFSTQGMEWQFNGEKIDADKIKDVDLSVNITTKEKDGLDKLVGNRAAVVVELADNGDLPGEALLNVSATKEMEDYLGEDNLQICYWNEKKKKLEEIEKNVAIDEDSNISFAIEHCSTYVVLGQKTVRKIFSDIPAGQWYISAVQFVYDRKIMNGISAISFAPQMTLTREQFITVLYNLEGSPEITFKKYFDDVTEETSWYAKSVTWAAENEITSGIGGNKFGTGKEITREQLATLLYNYAQKKDEYKLSIDENAVANFPDANKIDSWASDGMKWAITNGVMSGKKGKDGQLFLDPLGKATRAECAQMIKNLKENAVK